MVEDTEQALGRRGGQREGIWSSGNEEVTCSWLVAVLGRLWMAVPEVQVTVWTLRGRESRSDEGAHGGSFLEKVAIVPRQG